QLALDVRGQPRGLRAPRAYARGYSRLMRQLPHLVQESTDADDPRLPKIAALLERTQEHQIHPEGVRAPLLDVGVGNDDVAPGLGHLRAVFDDQPVCPELRERLVEVQ